MELELRRNGRSVARVDGPDAQRDIDYYIGVYERPGVVLEVFRKVNEEWLPWVGHKP